MTPIRPPRLATRLLRSFVSEERIDELEGDLYEIFQEKASNQNSQSANWLYWWMVIRSFRSYALKNSKNKTINNMSHFYILLEHNLRLTLRQLWKQKATTSINIIGLAIGLAGFIAIFSLIRYENSFNHHIPDKENVYRLYTEYSGAFSGTNRGVPAPVPAYLKENLPIGIESVTGFFVKTFNARPNEVKSNEVYSKVKVVVADSSYFDVFGQYEWLSGNRHSSMSEPHQVVLEEQQAIKYFGNEPLDGMIGKEVIYNDSLHVFVSGIVKQKEGVTDFIFTDFISYPTIRSSWLKDQTQIDEWGSTNSASQAWIKTTSPISNLGESDLLENINQHMLHLKDDSDWIDQIRMAKLTDMHFDQRLGIFDNRGRAPASQDVLNIMMIASVALLFMAMFNFINLETAQASSRSKEVGIRKVLGSNRKSLIGKFILESMVITFLSMMLALPIAQYSMILFKEFLPGDININFWQLDIIISIVTLVILVGLFTGLYPAIRLSAIATDKALKSNGRMSFAEKGTPAFRKVLVSFQFLVAQLLIMAALTVYIQVNFLITKELGFESNSILNFQTPYYETESKRNVLIDELKQMPEITEILSRQQDAPTCNNYSSSYFTYRNGEHEISESVFRKSGDTSYLDFYGIQLIAGRMVIPSANSDEIIINDTYRKNLGFDRPEAALNAELEVDEEKSYTIVGVMDDFHTMSLRNPIVPVYFKYSDYHQGIAFKTSAASTQSVIDKITNRYRELYPREAAEISFLDEDLKNLYESEQRMSKLSAFITILAILISSLGLFGLVSLTVIQRTKEVGIRKVLGAGIWSIGKTLSREFVWLLAIAFLITVPTSYFISQLWLDNYAYRVELSWWLYAVGGIVSFIVAFLAMSSRIYQAASANPVESLRYE